jgi:pilus assembly protein CpaF
MTPPAAGALPAGLVDAVQRRLAAEHLPPEPAVLARLVRAEISGVIDDARMVDVILGLERELIGSGPLTALLADPATTDVVVNAPDDVRVDRGAGWQRTDVRFADDAAVGRLARRLAAMAGARLDDARPYVDGRLPDGTRLHAVLPPVAAAGACLSLRVLRPARFDLDALAAAGLFPGVAGPALRAILAARLAFLVCGGTGSGKTTLLSALLSAVSDAERIVTVEDADELRPRHPHVVRLVARAANVEGVGAIDLAELVRQALRMRPDRIVVGEVRGREITDLLSALSTGHEGGAGTLHANNARDVPARIAALAQAGGLSRSAAHAQLAGAVQVVLHLTRRSGARRLTEIAVLEPGSDGLVRALPAIVDGSPELDGSRRLASLLRDRGVPIPW